VGVVLLAAIGYLFLSRPPDAPGVRFTDVTESAGLRFRHTNGATGRKLLPETMGSGVVVLDFDGDGRPDLLVQVKALGELRLFTRGKGTSGSCAATSDAESVGDWCRSAVTTVEGKYKTDATPDYQIGSSFGASLAQ
jgi:hypothetical protein